MDATRAKVIAAALAVCTLAVYAPMLGYGFVQFDDALYVTSNPNVATGFTWDNVKTAFTATDRHYWQPVAWLSHMLDCELFRLSAGRHHLQSWLLHAVNTSLLFLLFWRLTGWLWPSAFAAGLHALHPLRVESVAWVAERNDLLSGFFGLLALLAYRNHAMAWVAVLFALGLMSKPILVTLPFCMLLLDYWPLRRREGWLVLVREKWLLFVMSAACAGVTLYAHLHKRSIDVPLYARVGNAVVSYVRYVGMMLWPQSLAVLYPHTGRVATSVVLLSGGALAAITWSAWSARSRRPYILVGWLWFLGTLVPMIGIVQSGFQAYADRFTYLPMIGICLAAAGLLAHAPVRYANAVAAAILVALTAVTSVQLRHWKDTIALFEHAVAVTGDNAIAEMYLGNALVDAGRAGEAVVHLKRAAAIEPASYIHAFNLGRAEYALGNDAGAEAAIRSALERNREHADSWYLLGSIAMRQGRAEAALDAFERSLRGGLAAEVRAQAANNAGILAATAGDLARAEKFFRQAADTGYPEARKNLALCLARQGRKREALEQAAQVPGAEDLARAIAAQ
jgi:Flp pilus assembly protein TadD